MERGRKRQEKETGMREETVGRLASCRWSYSSFLGSAFTCRIDAPCVQIQPRFQTVQQRVDKADIVDVLFRCVAALPGLWDWIRVSEADY